MVDGFTASFFALLLCVCQARSSGLLRMVGCLRALDGSPVVGIGIDVLYSAVFRRIIKNITSHTRSHHN